MKTMKQKRSKEFRERIMRNNLMKRFLHDIEREDALEANTLEIMLAYQPLRIR